ncbi:hypothetical protein CALCODRAFT_36320 [Calocera cornea HHB12733]|uniref:Uncharacterized protein n=1 Tax=Calocera cornea HHB12733 TaxID=1353952 RepID=A0A165DZN6_9BASI|nr:hypothetical protein CALCODRAFT_36320 [Calocera cornea HHB12733]
MRGHRAAQADQSWAVRVSVLNPVAQTINGHTPCKDDNTASGRSAHQTADDGTAFPTALSLSTSSFHYVCKNIDLHQHVASLRQAIRTLRSEVTIISCHRPSIDNIDFGGKTVTNRSSARPRSALECQPLACWTNSAEHGDIWFPVWSGCTKLHRPVSLVPHRQLQVSAQPSHVCAAVVPPAHVFQT